MSLDSDLPDAISEGVAVDAVGAHATSAGNHSQPIHTHCENCGQKLEGPYCHRCGQHDFDINRSFGHTFLEALENFFHFDTKLFRNLITLLFQPGRMTSAFNAGKRAAQMPPFRLYVFVSILFFFLTFLDEEKSMPVFQTSSSDGVHAGLTIDGESVTVKEAWEAVAAEAEEDPKTKKVIDKLKAASDSTGQDIKQKVGAAIEAAEKESGGEAMSEFDQAIEKKTRILSTPEGQREMLHRFLGTMPKLVLICLPLFALYTRFLFRKSGLVYLQHLVMALHFHTFIYLWLLTSKGWELLASFPSESLGGYVALFCNLWLVIYPFIMLKHMFTNSWILTVIKTLMLSFAYMMTLVTAFTVAAVLLVIAL